MAFPQQVQAVLDEVGTDGVEGTPAVQRACEGAKFHSPTPLVLHERPISPSGAGRTAWLCSTCWDNLKLLQHLLARSNGRLSWGVRREFGNIIRALAVEGWHIDHPDGDEGGEA